MIKTRRRQLIVGNIIGMLALAGLVACAAPADADPGNDYPTEQIVVRLDDGRSVTCVTYFGSIDCDWDNAK